MVREAGRDYFLRLILFSLCCAQDNVCNEVFDTLSYFMHIDDRESRIFALRSVGSMCIRHYDYMLGAELMTHYQMLLRGDTTPIPMKVQVFNGFEN